MGDTDDGIQIAWGPLAVVVVVVAGVLVALSGRYGYFRDELYFIACGRHLAWGYPDQPPVTPFIARVMASLGHGSLVVFRLPATAVAAGVTLLTGLMAAELGGGRFAQILAAVTAATSTYVLLSGHLLVTATVDLLVWVGLTWLVLRILRTGQEWLWLLVGVVAGIGLMNKQLPAVLLGGLLVGVVLTPAARSTLRSRWLWAGALIAAIAWVPVLRWQAEHGWPQLTIAAQIRSEYGTPGQRVGFVVLQLLLFGLGGTYLWIVGLARLWRDPASSRYRVLAWAWLAVLVFFVVTAGQGYYPAGVYPALIAAGAVVVEQRRRRWPVVVAVIATSALTMPAAIPILSPTMLAASPWNGLGETQRETVGWPQLVALVADAYGSIPPRQRSHAGIYANNYGEAGAIDLLGPALGLPQAWSGQNGFGYWGPPPQSVGPVVVVWEDGPPDGSFTGCRKFSRVRASVPNEESDRAAVFVCSSPIGGWKTAWTSLVHLSS
jgi:4-amino-4-deoxy-L-arabinose transferase-like glycosyltransferase